MKCSVCGGFDSFLQYYFIDKNGNVFDSSQLEAFKILHPYASGTFERVLLCGCCAAERQLNFQNEN